MYSIMVVISLVFSTKTIELGGFPNMEICQYHMDKILINNKPLQDYDLVKELKCGVSKNVK